MSGTACLPYDRVVALAHRLGGGRATPDHPLCPTDDRECWRHRGVQPYLPDSTPVTDECAECWLLWLLQGV